MAKPKTKLVRANVSSQLLKSDWAMEICNSIAQNIAVEAGEGYEAAERRYPERSGAAVFAATPRAVNDNYKNNTLEKLSRRKR